MEIDLTTQANLGFRCRRKPRVNQALVLALLGVALLFSGAGGVAQDWPSYGGDPGGTKYSALEQINKRNVQKLKVAWVFDTGDVSDGTEYPTRSAFEATPLVVDGILYVSTAFCRLIAFDAETGEKRWEFDPQIDKTMRINLFVNRGAAYWSDGEQSRLFLGDLHGRLFAIDAATGKPDREFGKEGWVDLREGTAEKFPGDNYSSTSPVAVCHNVIIAGSLVSDSEPTGPSGDVRGFDARTGRELWRFHTVPHPGEFGSDTWDDDSWKDRGGTNAWSMLSVDEQNGLVFLPLTSPSYDFYGGDRKGANLFGNSVVALNCETGERKWHFQTVHHDLWDYDLPAQPVLVNVRRDGKDVPAVAQVTKMGFVFLLDRLTGKPLFDVEEKAIPKSQIPGEETWPTQPYPVKPSPFARQSMSRDEITTVTPESRQECLEMLAGADVDVKLYDPLGETPSVIFPGLNGGTNWGGASFDPETGLLYVPSNNNFGVTSYYNPESLGGTLRWTHGPSGLPDDDFEGARPQMRQGLPLVKPPYSRMTAIDMNKGEHVWMTPLGNGDRYRNHPMLRNLNLPPLGGDGRGGPLLTKTLLISALTTGGSNGGPRLVAYDKATGAAVASVDLPAGAIGSPMTYMVDGKQYIAITVGGPVPELIAFALP